RRPGDVLAAAPRAPRRGGRRLGPQSVGSNRARRFDRRGVIRTRPTWRTVGMSISMLFTPKSMNAEQYDDIIKRLADAGPGSPDGRTTHGCLGEGDRLHVLDVWESQEKFERFGAVLMPILADVGVDPGNPDVRPVHNVID